MKILSTKAHGVIDYATGLLLILAPNIFNFENVGDEAVLIPRVMGVAIIIYSLMTRYELGIAKILSMKNHLAIDFVSGLLLAASPFIFGFSDHSANVWLPHVAVGLMEVAVVLMTKTKPESTSFSQTLHSHK